MEAFNNIVLPIHIVAGFISIAIFWIPIFAKKGGDIHVKVGKAYVYAMWIVVVTALILSIVNIINTHYVMAIFLGFLAFLTARPLWYGIAILKYKKNIPEHFLNIKRIMSGLLALAGMALIIWGVILKFQNEAILFIIFGVLGLSAIGDTIKSNHKARTSNNWIADHIGDMIVTGIAGYTAFFAFGGRTFFSEIFSGYFSIIPWILPTIIGVIIARFMKMKMIQTA